MKKPVGRPSFATVFGIIAIIMALGSGAAVLGAIAMGFGDNSSQSIPFMIYAFSILTIVLGPLLHGLIAYGFFKMKNWTMVLLGVSAVTIAVLLIRHEIVLIRLASSMASSFSQRLVVMSVVQTILFLGVPVFMFVKTFKNRALFTN